ncbi:UBC-like protein [Exidia glandulosa HHB12029]|uniref:UBC-like protein n=1 Tax=Exidia glandulosa HHB12029 TaxID=1314781 RepID=A0A165GFF7_EXIGL|nr:UBC-like protein [Exidia glandulosa HHB12029]
MATRSTHNKNNSAVKRILQEARELANDPSTDYVAAPLEEDIFEWHCTIRGSPDTEFEGGLYHVRILLPGEYPFRPPSIMMLTPNGRFELNTKICISFTNYHEELWQPAWGIRTAIIGLQGFFPLKGKDAVGVGAIEYPVSERKRLAALSRNWTCPHCQQPNIELLPDPPAASSDAAPAQAQPPEAAVSSAPPAIVAHVPSGPVAAHPPTPGEGRHVPAELAAMTASMTPFAPQAVVPQRQPQQQQQAVRQPQTNVLAMFDFAIATTLMLLAYFLGKKLGVL